MCPIPIENCTPLKKILNCLNIGFILTFLKTLMLKTWQRLLQNFELPQYSIPQKKKWIFKQSAAPTLATLAGAANGLRPLAARGLAGVICLLSHYLSKCVCNLMSGQCWNFRNDLNQVLVLDKKPK